MENKKRILYLLLLLIVFPSLAFAQRNLAQEFKNDTAAIESCYRGKLDKDYTTYGMIQANIQLEEDYDLLLNKYYKILIDQLNTEEKQILKESQRNWIKLRDSDKSVVSMLREKAYREAGGGTIWGVVSSGAIIEITKQRVLQLFDFLVFDDLGGQ